MNLDRREACQLVSVVRGSTLSISPGQLSATSGSKFQLSLSVIGNELRVVDEWKE